MESFDSSPNHSSDARKENSPGESENDDTISVNSSTCGSSTNNSTKYRTSNKKAFGNVRSFRRRTKSRFIQSTTPQSTNHSPVESPHSSPHYLKSTTSSECKKSHSQTSPKQSASPSEKSFQTLSRTSSLRSVRILIRKSSFRPKRSSLHHSKASEDNANVDRATYSSTIKDSKFPQPVEILPENNSAVKVCRYHHCSLHGHCQGGEDPAPPLKRFLYKRRRNLKRQKSIVPNSESRPRGKNSSDRKKNVQKSPIAPVVEQLNQEKIYDSTAFLGDENENGVDSELFGHGVMDVQESSYLEVAFGEMSFPERSYHDNLDVLRRYSIPDQDIGGTDFGESSPCLKCSCHNREDMKSTTRRSEASQHKDDAPNLDVSNNEASGKDCPGTPLVFDEATEKSSLFSSSSDKQTSSGSNSEEEVEFTPKSTTTGDSKADEVVQVVDSEAHSPVQTGSRLQFSKPRHISMWHLIQQHMSSNLSVEPTEKPVDGESPVDGGADSLLVKESTASSRDVPDSDTGGINNKSETQEIEVRKLLAIKLVREAIEKILLPEVQDQTSDDQSVTSESTPRPELVENNQSKVFGGEREEANASSNQIGNSVAPDDASIPDTQKEKQVVRKPENKAPKHWSNLKKWILLQRFIGALEKVRKFNPRKPRFLLSEPDPEAEKVNLRPQTVDGRKNAEEWMLDYALRQAVSQLAPTQKKKVSLLVRAFETVVPPQQDSPVYRITRLMEKETETVDDVKDNAELMVKLQSSNGQRIGKLASNEMLSRSCTSIGGLPESKEENPRADDLDLHRSYSDTAKVGKVIENETAKTLEGHQRDAASDCGDGKVNDGGKSNQMERKNNIKMWHMIYQHVVSDIAEKVGSHLLDGSEDDEEEDGNSSGVSTPTNDSSEEKHDSGNLRGGLTKSDALKLVKEAVDEILLPEEVQDDSSNTQSVTSERNLDEIEETKAESEAIKEKAPPKAKNWRKLKKLLLLKRSIKALEKARESKPEPNQLVPQTADPEPEKIDLRCQIMDERKKAEKWMLDYAVQHIVTKLTPARKRRVSMLVEAFEAVVPLPET